MKTMDDVYGDGSNHKVCEKCGMCIICRDCICGMSDEEIKDDIKFSIKTEKAYQQIEKGKCTRLPVEEFLKEFARW